ncbi:transporter [Dictyobacter kobayashii]|uniref:Transporter n=1 Tax=Dictyobacter kobayashii TaxID=2014872 RepID=A0A402ABI1_9CHLR|nr:carbohydrate ABC transporter permease [Dictyobacter kobayashii]GCE16455.1 transporter [Dictyobacter kobayashii]
MVSIPASRNKATRRSRKPLSSIISSNVVRALVVLYVLIILVPIYYLVISAFKSNDAIFTQPLSLPTSLSLQNFAAAQDDAGLFQAMGVSIYITVCAELLTLLLALPAAYGIARIPLKGTVLIERLFGISFLIPGFAVLVPTFLLSIQLGLFHSTLFLILFYPVTALPLTVIMMAQFMRSIPYEIEEAAIVDGANRLVILVRLMIPLCMPGIATMLILNFLNFWNEYIFALVILGGDTQTVQVALPLLKTLNIVDYGLLTAGTLLTVIPVYLVYIVIQRKMQEALVAGYAKG